MDYKIKNIHKITNWNKCGINMFTTRLKLCFIKLLDYGFINYKIKCTYKIINWIKYGIDIITT